MATEGVLCLFNSISSFSNKRVPARVRAHGSIDCTTCGYTPFSAVEPKKVIGGNWWGSSGSSRWTTFTFAGTHCRLSTHFAHGRLCFSLSSLSLRSSGDCGYRKRTVSLSQLPPCAVLRRSPGPRLPGAQLLTHSPKPHLPRGRTPPRPLHPGPPPLGPCRKSCAERVISHGRKPVQL